MPFIDLETVPSQELVPGFSVKLIHSEQMTVASYSVSAGAVFPEHAHVNEQISYLIEGEFELTIDSETKTLKPGIVAVIPANARHSGRALSDCIMVDIFHPVRSDYKRSSVD